jgi:hypothetical protein
VLVAGLIFLALLFVPLMVRRSFDPLPLAPNVRVLVMVPIIYAISIVLAIYPKSVLPFWRREPDKLRPVAAYALSGAAAAIAAFAVSLLFRFAFDSKGSVIAALSTEGAFSSAWNTSIARWPWLLMTFFTTVAIAWAADDRPESNSAKSMRLIELGSLAAVFGALQWTVLQLLIATAVSAEYQSQLQSATAQMVLTATLIGASIGWFVPHLYRTRGYRARQLSTDAPTLSMPPNSSHSPP